MVRQTETKETDMNVQGTTEIRELVATELDEVSGGQTVGEWLYEFALDLYLRTMTRGD
jgi:hypothetical protein